MKWVQTSHGIYNAAAITCFRRLKDGRTEVIGDGIPNGCTVSLTREALEEALLCELIPAAPGTKGVMVACYEEDGKAGCDAKEASIVAWRVEHTGMAHPVFAGNGPCSNERILLILPDGRYDEPHGGIFSSLEEAKHQFLREFKGEP